MHYLDKYINESEFYKSLLEFFGTINQKYLSNIKILEGLALPNNIIEFEVAWVNDLGVEVTNKGYRVQYNNVNGIYKGGLRFHPSVNLNLFKALAFEQTFKNLLTSLPMGGAKGGSDFDPKGKSDSEIRSFCYAFMEKLYPYIGVDIDVPAGDIGVGTTEIRHLYEAYKFYSGKDDCALTGKPLDLGGSLGRIEATGFGLVYFALEALKTYSKTNLKQKKVIVSGSGNVALYCAKKVVEEGGIVVAMSDSDNSIFDVNGLDIDEIIRIKLNKQRIKTYALKHKTVVVDSNKKIWSYKCDYAFPCATQFELDLESADFLIKNGCQGVFEGANMPCTSDAIKAFILNKIIYSPGKASNAGGVIVSYFEIQQNVNNEKWSFEKVDYNLRLLMCKIFNNIYNSACECGCPFDLVTGANNFALSLYMKKYMVYYHE